MRAGLLEDGLGRLLRGRRPRGRRGLQAEVGERRADVDHNGALERVVGGVGVEVVGLVQVLLVEPALGGRLGRGRGRAAGLVHRRGGDHLVGRDGQGRLKLLGEIARLGAHGHCHVSR